MNQFQRLKKWDDLIRLNRFPGISNFCEMAGFQLEVSERTLEGDIKQLKKILIEKYPQIKDHQLLRYSRSKKGYYYTDTVTAFTDIDARDYRSLQELSRSLSGFEHLFITNEAKNAFYKLKAIAKEEESTRNSRYISWNPVQYLREGVRDGQEFFDPLIKAIEELRAVTLFYKAFGSSEQRKHMVLPIMIKEWQNAWYLLAYPLQSIEKTTKIFLKKDSLQLFALNRMERISEESLLFRNRINNLIDFNPADYFKYAFGVYRSNLIDGKQPPLFRLQLETIDPWMYGYINKTPIHPTMHVLENVLERSYVRFTMDLEWSPELETFLLQFSPMLKLTGNKKALEKFKERLESIRSIYKL